jgi:uncharacterized protein (DUF849 family)
MNEQDLRDCFAMFALCGYTGRMGCNPLERGSICEDGVFADNNAEAIAKASYIMADAMLEARNNKEEELGIAAVKTKRQYVRKTYHK